jgi:hypothetical protein
MIYQVLYIVVKDLESELLWLENIEKDIIRSWTI